MGVLLIDYLRSCCVRVVVDEASGCGFFIAPRLVVTCSHVVGNSAKVGDSISLEQWHQGKLCQLEGAIILGNFPDDDIAFIQTISPSKNFAPLNGQATLGNKLAALGFPNSDTDQTFDQFTAIYEGKTFFLRGQDRARAESKFKAGQVEPGFSGGPLLNLETLRVMGVVVATRDKLSSLGGWAIEISVVERLLQELQQEELGFDSNWLQLEKQEQEITQKDLSSTESRSSENTLEVKTVHTATAIRVVVTIFQRHIIAVLAFTIVISSLFFIRYWVTLESAEYSPNFSNPYEMCSKALNEALLNRKYQPLPACEEAYKICLAEKNKTNGCQNLIDEYPIFLKTVSSLNKISE